MALHQLDLSKSELVFGLDGMRDAVIDKIRRAVVMPDYTLFRDKVPFDTFQQATSTQLVLYGRFLQLYQSLEGTDAEFIDNMSLNEKQWELLNKIDSSAEWADMPLLTEDEFDELSLGN